MPDVVEVIVPGPIAIVEVPVAGPVGLIEAAIAGPQGPAGPAGSGAAYIHTQGSPASSWTVNHNLGFRPAVTVLSAGGVEVEAAVLHTSVNQTVISFAIPAAGTARFV